MPSRRTATLLLAAVLATATTGATTPGAADRPTATRTSAVTQGEVPAPGPLAAQAALVDAAGTEPSDRQPDIPAAGDRQAIVAERQQAADRRAAEQARRAAEQAERDRVAAAQARLAELGWQPGPADGLEGPQTHRATERFQQAAGLDPTGVLDEQTVKRLEGADAPAAPQPDPAPEPAAPAGSASASMSRQAQAEQIADRLPFDWRSHGVTITVGCHPEVRCSWGVYDYRDRTVWIGPDAFASGGRLRYVVTHEIAHAWQWTNNVDAREQDLAGWGHTGMAGLERAADCLANVWGASSYHYWNCPSDARSHVAAVWQSTR